ncbi:MAG TPA: hypothetical protein VFI11_09080 [Anaerolineales bacterium]|nr:hypothetical protein [Anaerolineales bacterium]
MASAAAGPRQDHLWLWNRRWDLMFISLSVLMVGIPYLTYLGLLSIETSLAPFAARLGTTVGDLSRNVINGIVALSVGGPHMYATFSRTAMDTDFARRNPWFLRASLLIPVIVVTLAVVNLPLLLTVFFFWASIHVLHQIVYITELYNQRQPKTLSLISRAADYGVILTCLYPLAAWKISTGDFKIGLNDLSAVVGSIVPLGPWMVWAASAAFGLALLVWLGKTVMEARQGTIHWPKTIFIGLTVVASFFVPALGNLDTAFQGMNLWHSFQYLALTWMINHLRWQRGELERSPFVKRMSTDGSARSYYVFNIFLTIADGALAVVVFFVMRYVFGTTFDFAFDRAYYIAILSFLWIHYYHDHFLFTQPQVIRQSAPAAAVPATAAA